MPEITVTLGGILDAKPCYDPREKDMLPNDHALDAPISFREIVAKAGPEDAIWCFCDALRGHDAMKRRFAVDCAERVRRLDLDERSLNALASALDIATIAGIAAACAARAVEWTAARDAAYDAAQRSAKADERKWQAARIIQLTEAG